MDKVDLMTKSILSLLGAAISWAVGGISLVVIVLASLMLADFITGIMAAQYQDHSISSRTAAIGLMKKSYILILTFCIYMFEQLGIASLGLDVAGFSGDAVAFMFAISELLSIIENGYRMDTRLPQIIADFVRESAKFLNYKE